MEDLFLGKFKAIVKRVLVDDPDGTVYGDEDYNDGMARITVICPPVYGINPVTRKFVESPVCQPCINNPHDWFVPEPGQTVWVSFEEGNGDFPVWEGSWPTEKEQRKVAEALEDGDNELIEEKLRGKYPTSLVNKKEDFDRIIGSRFGSYIKFDDKDESIILQTFGPTADPDRAEQDGPRIRLDNKDVKIYLGDKTKPKEFALLGVETVKAFKEVTAKIVELIDELVKPANIATGVGPAQFNPAAVTAMNGVKTAIGAFEDSEQIFSETDSPLFSLLVEIGKGEAPE